MSHSIAELLDVVSQKKSGYTKTPKVGQKISVYESIHEGDDGDGEFNRIVTITKVTKTPYGTTLEYGRCLHHHPFLEKGDFVKVIK